jgi:20S proteasome subunit alpha 3
MSRRYDSRTTTFSPEGRLYQVEYAVEAISHAGTAIGILTTEGIVLATEKRTQGVLLDTEQAKDRNISGEKVFKISDHLCCAAAGITSDANLLIKNLRIWANQHAYSYQEPMAAEDLCRNVCDQKQAMTQYGGLRPFGVSFLIGGWDRYYGYQLYNTDPSGNYSAWKAYAIGQGDQVAQSLLKQDWKPTMNLREGLLLALKVLGKTMDSTNLTTDRVEVATLQRVKAPAERSLLDPHGSASTMLPSFTILDAAQLKPLLEEAEKIRLAEEAAEAAKEKETERGETE